MVIIVASSSDSQILKQLEWMNFPITDGKDREVNIWWQETSPCHPDPGMSPPTACRAAVPSVEILAVEEVLR